MGKFVRHNVDVILRNEEPKRWLVDASFVSMTNNEQNVQVCDATDDDKNSYSW